MRLDSLWPRVETGCGASAFNGRKLEKPGARYSGLSGGELMVLSGPNAEGCEMEPTNGGMLPHGCRTSKLFCSS